MKNIVEAVPTKQERITGTKEGLHKDVEAAFCVLVSRWKILRQSCRIWSREKMAVVMNACIIMHTMIVELCREHYESKLWRLAISALGRTAIVHTTNVEIPFV